MSETTQNAFGGAISTGAAPGDLLRQQDTLGALRGLAETGPGPVLLDPMSEEAMDILRSWPAREQGRDRSTCTAFAMLGMVEFNERLASQQAGIPDYSEEYLYSMMRRKHVRCPLPPNFEDGSCFLEQACDALRVWGVCDDRWMPYDPKTTVPDFLMFPPQAAKTYAQHDKFAEDTFQYTRLYLKKENGLDGREVWKQTLLTDLVRKELKSGKAVTVAFPIYRDDNQWTHPAGSGWRRGKVLDPTTFAHVVDAFQETDSDKTPIIGGHAVCIVGYRTGTDDAEGRFVFRNSWGERFAAEYRDLNDDPLLRLPRAGYGTISESHLENHCWEIAFETRDGKNDLPAH